MLASTCFAGIKQTGPTTFAVSKQNFRPTEDIAVLSLEAVSTP